MSEASDEQLYARWSAGDEQAGALLVRRRMPGVRRVVHSMLANPEADDAIQEVFERLARRAQEGREIRELRTFVSGIARKVVLEQLRKRRSSELDFHHHSLAELRPNQVVELERKEDCRLLLKALHRMPVEDQLLVALRYWQQLRTKQLADLLELNHNTLRTRLRRVEQRLRERINQLAESPEALESTIGSLSKWAREQGVDR